MSTYSTVFGVWLQRWKSHLNSPYAVLFIGGLSLFAFVHTVTYLSVPPGVGLGDLATLNQVQYNIVNDLSFGASWHNSHNFFTQTHFMPILFLTAPIYAFFPSALTLLLITQVAWVAGAYFVGKIAEFQFDNRWLGVLFMGLVILHRSVVLTSFSAGFRGAILAFPFVALAIYAFMTKRLGYFLGAMVLASLCKENISLLFVLFSGWAAYDRRDYSWLVAPAVLGIGYFVFVNEFIMGAEGFSGHNFSYFAHLGGGPLDIALTLLLNPLLLVDLALSFDHVAFVFKFLSPTAFLSLLSPTVLFLPVSQWLVVILPEPVHFAAIDHHYQAPILPFMFTATILGIHRGEKLLRQYGMGPKRYSSIVDTVRDRFSIARPVRAFLIVLVYSSILLHSPIVEYSQDAITDIPDNDLEEIRALDSIPSEASVMSQRTYAPYLSNRAFIYNYEYRDTLYDGEFLDADYVVVNKSVARRYDSSGGYEREQTLSSIDAVIFEKVKA